MIPELFLICALAMPAQEAIHPLTDDAMVFQLLGQYRADQILFFNRPWDAMLVINRLREFYGIILLESTFGELRGFFNDAGFHRVPYHYGTYEIYQRSA